MKQRVVFAVLAALLLTLFGCKPDPIPVVTMIEGPTFEDSVAMFRIVGRVKNTGGGTANYPRVRIYIRDDENALLANNWNYCDDTALGEGEVSYFEVLFWDEDHEVRDDMDLSKMTYEITFD